ncbi:MAG TPA: gamma-mobile-trio recombinase GmtY [Holophagaceae bacterium]|nr:gamma-mobile-trio recombinase GmtY [Holophagaceae bacterium]
MFITLRCRVFSNETGAFTEVPAIFTPAGWLMPLVAYCVARSHDRSRNWMVKVCHSMRLFLEYIVANPNELDIHRQFQNFAQCLYTGTFNRLTGFDPSWLCWKPKSSAEARRTIGSLTDFFEWWCCLHPTATQVNPQYAGNSYDLLVAEAAYQFRRSRAFLGHTWKPQSALTKGGFGHAVMAKRGPKIDPSNPPAFPDDRFMELLMEGFVVGGRPNYRDMLITLLLHGAGFRYSEPFHLYLTDVLVNPRNHQELLDVRIHHPLEGEAPNDPNWVDERGTPRKGNRPEYLAERFGLVPRNLLLDGRHAGWKGGVLDDKSFMRAHWFIPKFGDLFLTLWYRYLEQVARLDRSHPFAWANLSQDPKGEMYSMTQYWRAHARACQRIGLVVGKELGTTPHGHRHAYGRRLLAGGFTAIEIKKFMHHHMLESQAVYTTPTPQQVMDVLSQGAERLHQKYRRDL